MRASFLVTTFAYAVLGIVIALAVGIAIIWIVAACRNRSSAKKTAQKSAVRPAERPKPAVKPAERPQKKVEVEPESDEPQMASEAELAALGIATEPETPRRTAEAARPAPVPAEEPQPRKKAPAPRPSGAAVPHTENAELRKEAPPFGVRYVRSFEAKLIQSSDEAKARYSEIRNALEAYGFKARRTWNGEGFRTGRQTPVRLIFRGKTLRVCLALDPDEFAETKYRPERAEGKRFELTPCMLPITSDRRAGYACELIALVAARAGLAAAEVPEKDFRPAWESTEALLEKGLIREVAAIGGEETWTEEDVAEPAEPMPTEEDVEAAAEQVAREAELPEGEGRPAVGVLFRRRARKVYWFDPAGKTWKKGEIAAYRSDDGGIQQVVVVAVTRKRDEDLRLPLKSLHKLTRRTPRR